MFQAILQRFVQWCYYSKDYAFIRDSKYGIPILQSLHLTGITLLLGITLILNLRLLGIGFRRLPLPLLSEQLWPWMKTALLLAIVAGIMVFLPDPTRYAHSGPFRLKMILLCLALLYQFTVFRKVVQRDPETRHARRNAALAAISLLLWFGVGWSGRAIAFFQ
jgi:uncharacterized protein DUF6644